VVGEVAFSGVELSDHVFAASCIAFLIAAQCLRDALWVNGFAAVRPARVKA
jgi:hypothetical protein